MASSSSNVRFVHSISEAGRLLPSASQWNSIELDFKLAPQSSISYDSLPSRFSKSYNYDLIIRDKSYFKKFVFVLISILLLIIALILLLHFLPPKHHHHTPSKNLTLAVNQALTFFDAQKCNTIIPFFIYLFSKLEFMFFFSSCHLSNNFFFNKFIQREISRRRVRYRFEEIQDCRMGIQAVKMSILWVVFMILGIT